MRGTVDSVVRSVVGNAGVPPVGPVHADLVRTPAAQGPPGLLLGTCRAPIPVLKRSVVPLRLPLLTFGCGSRPGTPRVGPASPSGSGGPRFPALAPPTPRPALPSRHFPDVGPREFTPAP